MGTASALENKEIVHTNKIARTWKFGTYYISPKRDMSQASDVARLFRILFPNHLGKGRQPYVQVAIIYESGNHTAYDKICNLAPKHIPIQPLSSRSPDIDRYQYKIIIVAPKVEK